MKNAIAVKCVETGDLYYSIAEVARENNVSEYIMRNIIKNSKRMVNNKHFIKCNDGENFMQQIIYNGKIVTMEFSGKWTGTYPTTEGWIDTNILFGDKYKFFTNNIEKDFNQFKLCLINPLRARKGNFYVRVNNDKIICQNHHVDVMKEHYPELYKELSRYLETGVI